MGWLTASLTQARGQLGEGNFNPLWPSFWLASVNSVSQGYALYVLYLFYQATHKELVQIHPFGKFLALKTIVFFSFWQGVVIGVLVQQGAITEMDMLSAQTVARAIKDLLVCFEMFLASIAYLVMFPVSDFVPTPPANTGPENDRERTTLLYALSASLLPVELHEDILLHSRRLWVHCSELSLCKCLSRCGCTLLCPALAFFGKQGSPPLKPTPTATAAAGGSSSSSRWPCSCFRGAKLKESPA